MAQFDERLQPLKGDFDLPTPSIRFQHYRWSVSSIQGRKNKSVSCRFERFRFNLCSLSAVFLECFTSGFLRRFFTFLQCANPARNERVPVWHPCIPISQLCLGQRS